MKQCDELEAAWSHDADMDKSEKELCLNTFRSEKANAECVKDALDHVCGTLMNKRVKL